MLKQEFDQIASAVGSTYAAVNLISKQARIKLEETNYRILDSKAISWAITGVAPKIPSNKTVANLLNSVSYLNDTLANIEDRDIRTSVEASYRASLYADHLIYCYQSGLDEYAKARVRILVNLVWENKDKEEF